MPKSVSVDPLPTPPLFENKKLNLLKKTCMQGNAYKRKYFTLTRTCKKSSKQVVS